MQQKSANRSQKAKDMKQRIENRMQGFRHSDQLSHDYPRKPSVITGQSRLMLCIKARSLRMRSRTRDLSGDTRNSVHPNSSNTWGECHANVAHKNMDKKHQGKSKNDEVDAKAAPIGKDDVPITSTVTSLGALDSMSTVSTVTDDMFAQSCLDLNKRSMTQTLVSEI
jgi:hypothetical protein